MTIVIATVEAPVVSATHVKHSAEGAVREPYRLRAKSAADATLWHKRVRQVCEAAAAAAALRGNRTSWSTCEGAAEEWQREQGARQLAENWSPSKGTHSSGGSPRDEAALLEAAAEEEAATGQRLRAAALNGSLALMRGVLLSIERNNPAALDEAGTDGQTALHIAAQCGHETLVEALLGAGAQVDVLNKVTGRTPLHAGCVAGSAACASLLLRSGADATLTDARGRTALQAAAKYKQPQVLALEEWTEEAKAEALAAASPSSPRKPAPAPAPASAGSLTPRDGASGSPRSPAAEAAGGRLARLEALRAAEPVGDEEEDEI